MASYCDTVQDALTITDAMAFGVAQDVASDNGLRISDAFKLGAFTPLADALTIADAVIEMWTQGVKDTLTVRDAVQDHLVTACLLRDRLRIRDAVAIALIDHVGDTLSISDATSVGVAHTVSDSLTVGDGAVVSAVTTTLARDALHISDAVRSGLVSLLADTLTIADAVEQRQSLVSLAADSLTIGDAASVSAAVAQLVTDSLTIDDAVAQKLATASLVADALVIEDRAQGGSPAAWSAHVEPFAMSRYSGLGFNSMAEVGGYLLLAGEGGIFLSGGSTDAGLPVAARIEHDLSDDVPDGRGAMVSDEHHKRPRYLYASYHSDGQLAIELGYVDDNDASDGYIERQVTEVMPAMNSAQFRTGRVALSRGVRSRYLRPTLSNVSGADFSMNDASLQVDSIKRKA